MQLIGFYIPRTNQPYNFVPSYHFVVVLCVCVLGSCPLHFKHCMVVMYIQNTICSVHTVFEGL